MKIKYHKPKNELLKITELYCFVTINEDNEKIVALSMKHPETGEKMMAPFMATTEDAMEELKIQAKEICTNSKMKIKLIKLTNREELEVI